MRVSIDGKLGVELGERTVIGRDAGCTIVLHDPRVSRKHALIQRSPDGSCFLIDLESSQGTYVDGQKISAAILRSGNVVRIGGSQLTFEEAAQNGSRKFRPGSAIRHPQDLQRDYEHLRAAYELTQRIGVEQDETNILTRILDATFDLLPAERAAIILVDPETHRTLRELKRTRASSEDELILSRTILNEVLTTKKGVLSADAGADARFSRSESIIADGVRSAMCVPLLHMGDVLGVMHADSLHATNAFQNHDLELFSSIARAAALALKNMAVGKKLQAMIEADRARLEEILACMPTGVILLGPDQVLLRANAAATKVLEDFAPGSRTGAPLLQLGNDEIKDVLDRCKLGPFDLERAGRICTVSGASLINTSSEQFLLTIQDVTEKRSRERHAAHADRLSTVGQLAGGLAHDFNNVLTVILTNAESLMMVLHDRADVLVDLECIVEATRRCEAITKQLLAFSRRDTVQASDIVVGQVIRDARCLFDRAVRERATVKYELTPAENEPKVHVDKVAIEQVLMNLLVNAKDAMCERGQIVLRTSTANFEAPRELGGERLDPGYYLHVEVADSGEGMSPEILAHIFEPFFTTKERGKGTGLGLSTAYGLVKQAGGTIFAESVLGRGTTFHLYFPEAPATGKINASKAA